MKKFKLSLLILFALISSLSKSQDYSLYYDLINEAEERFVEDRDSSCYAKFDQAFESFEPFLKDPYIAAQIALHLGDTNRFYHYLTICFQNGMPITALNSSPLISNSIIDREIISEIFDKTYNAKQVDTKTMEDICLKCYQSDSIKTVSYTHLTLPTTPYV